MGEFWKAPIGGNKLVYEEREALEHHIEVLVHTVLATQITSYGINQMCVEHKVARGLVCKTKSSQPLNTISNVTVNLCAGNFSSKNKLSSFLTTQV